MKNNKIIKTVVWTLMIASMVLLCVSFFPTKEDSDIYGKVIRLHVIANSDNDYDQQLKLKVRDAILAEVEKWEIEGGNIEEVKDFYEKRLDILKKTAENTVNDADYKYPINLSLEKEHYPVKSYNDFSLPSGTYLSLKVEIGEAEGKNWWCVLYPPLCLSAAKSEEVMVQAGFTGEQVKIVTENDSSAKYKVKFKLLEGFKALFDFFDR